ncbi:unnamed protein product [Musa textilis]
MSSTEQSPSPPLPNRSAEVRRDAIFDRWVLISPARARRPSDFKSHSPASSSSSASGNPNPKPSCAFCAGREGECAPEIFRVPPPPPPTGRSGSSRISTPLSGVTPSLQTRVMVSPPPARGGAP